MKKLLYLIITLLGLSVVVTAYKPPAPILGAVVQDSQLYPNPKLTPGVVATTNYKELTTVSKCGTYSKCHRKTSEAVKKQVCAEYPNNCKGVHEIDHLIPLALGGSDALVNLWAEPEHVLTNGEDLDYHAKDRLESYLVIQMKLGKISPQNAQECLLKDWVKCYHLYIAKNLGGIVTNDPD